MIGADGIERSLEDQLSPYISLSPGTARDRASTRAARWCASWTTSRPTDGNSVVLTIDVDLQNVMREALVDNIEYIRWHAGGNRRLRPLAAPQEADILAQYAEEEREISLCKLRRAGRDGSRIPAACWAW